MLVQIYEVRRPEEAAALVGLGVDHIGVLVGDGAFPRELSAAHAQAIFAAVPAPAKRVALSLSADVDEVARVVVATRPNIIHVGAALEVFPAARLRALKLRFPETPAMRSIPVVDAGSIAAAVAHDGIADLLLLDSHSPGDPQIGALGRTHDWSLSRRIVASVRSPVILAGGLGPDNVAAAIAAVGPAGVDSKTRTDRADGRGKDLDKVRDFVAAAKASRFTR